MVEISKELLNIRITTTTARIVYPAVALISFGAALHFFK